MSPILRDGMHKSILTSTCRNICARFQECITKSSCWSLTTTLHVLDSVKSSIVVLELEFLCYVCWTAHKAESASCKCETRLCLLGSVPGRLLVLGGDAVCVGQNVRQNGRAVTELI